MVPVRKFSQCITRCISTVFRAFNFIETLVSYVLEMRFEAFCRNRNLPCEEEHDEYPDRNEEHHHVDMREVRRCDAVNAR